MNAETEYSIKFTELMYLFANGVKMHQVKAKDSELIDYPVCLGNYWKNFKLEIWRKLG